MTTGIIILKLLYSLHFWFIILAYILGPYQCLHLNAKKNSIMYYSKTSGFGLLSETRIGGASETLTMGSYNFHTTQKKKPLTGFMTAR